MNQGQVMSKVKLNTHSNLYRKLIFLHEFLAFIEDRTKLTAFTQ